MEAITSKFATILLFISMITLLANVSAYTSYEKTQLQGYLPPKPVIPKEEHGGYGKSTPKIPTNPVIPKEEHGKSIPKIPTKPKVPKEEHGKSIPTKPMVPKEEHGKSIPKIPTKPVIPKEEHGSYVKRSPKTPTKPGIPKEEHGKSNPKAPTPMLPKVPEHPKNIAVQGLIYCKYGSKLIPLKGATARVTCLAVHKNGYESAPFSFSSCPADEKGYFLAKISAWKLLKDEDLWEVTECKSFLENSPWTNCKVPEDTNGGINGAHLTFSRLLNGYSLSSVGPFIYNAGPQHLPKEGY